MTQPIANSARFSHQAYAALHGGAPAALQTRPTLQALMRSFRRALAGVSPCLMWMLRHEVASLARRSFVKRLNAHLAKMQGNPPEFGLLVVDVANIRAIERDCGAKTAQACLKFAEAQLGRFAASTDLSGVVRASRFVLACYDADSVEHLEAMGRSMVACGLSEHAGKPAQVNIQIRVATAVLNTQGASAKRILEHVEYVLFRHDQPMVAVKRPFCAQYESSGF